VAEAVKLVAKLACGWCGSSRGEAISAEEAGSHVRNIQARTLISNVDDGPQKHRLFESAELEAEHTK
jgi:hypothetical protein